MSMPEGTQRIGKWNRGVRERGTTVTRTSKDFRNPAIAPLDHSLVHRVVVQDESLLQLTKDSIQSKIGVEVLKPTDAGI